MLSSGFRPPVSVGLTCGPTAASTRYPKQKGLGKKHRWESASLKPAREQNPKICLLELTAELRRRHTDDTPEHLSEMARARVAYVERDLDQAARRFADELLRTGDAFARNETQRRHAGRLLEDTREVEGTELN